MTQEVSRCRNVVSRLQQRFLRKLSAAVTHVGSAREESPYTALRAGEFRILNLLSGDFGSPLQADLQIETLDNRQMYEAYKAISYTRGEHTLSHRINLANGRVIKINASLHSALQHIRSPNKSLRLWADAACIDQSNKLEKSAQVARMYDVYERAELVIAWLGESGKSDELAFDLIDTRDFDREQGQLPERSESVAWTINDGKCAEDEVPEDWLLRRLTALSRILSRPWFSRVWVVQEVHAAQNGYFQCGYLFGTWRALVRSVALWARIEGQLGEIQTQLLAQKQREMPIFRDRLGRKVDFKMKPPCFSTMVSLAARQCSDPRDRVFAVLGMLLLE